MKRISTLKHNLMRATLTLALIVTCAMAWAQSGNWSEYKASGFSSASGTTINITNEAELALLASSSTDFTGYTITLTRDLDMSAHYWDKPIGNSSNQFRATFDGGSHTISGINCTSTYGYRGLFGYVGKGGQNNAATGTVRHLTLANSTITGKENVGGIAGFLMNGTISDCHVLPTVTIQAVSDGSSYHGGIVGQLTANQNNTTATIQNCTCGANITSGSYSNCSSYGGIIGYYSNSSINNTTLTNCFYYGTSISANSNVGAIVGHCWSTDGISNCYYHYPSTISGFGDNNSVASVKQVYQLTLGAGTTYLTISSTPTYNFNGTHYYAADATATVATTDNTLLIESLSASTGSISNVAIASDKHSATFTMGSDVTLTATLYQSVSYIDADGTTKICTDYTVLTGNESEIGSDNQTTWYVVNSNITHNGQISFLGHVNIILADNKTMTVNGGSYNAFANTSLHSNSLTIYGQSEQNGTLTCSSTTDAICNELAGSFVVNGGIVNVTGGSSSSKGINSKNVTINGGTVNANGYFGIYANRGGNLAINGGTVNANGTWGIYGNCNITLSWKNDTDRIYASQYYGYTISIAEGKYFKDANGNIYCGNVSANSINNKTLQPATQTEGIQYCLGTSNDGSAEHPYTINDANGWNAFCDALQDKATWNGFSGKIVKLGANISVSRMAGTYSATTNSGHAFSGAFNGQNNTLTFSCTAADNYVAPFAYLSGTSAAHASISDLNVVTNITATNYRHIAGLIAVHMGYVDVTNCHAQVTLSATKGTNNPTDLYPAGLVSQVSSSDNGTLTISGCTVTGTIDTDGKYAAGMVGVVQGSATITNSVSSVTINSSRAGDGTHGGFVAVSHPGSTTIEGCLFNGKLLTVNTGETTATTNCGGFVGWRGSGSVTISNSLYAPANIANNETEAVGSSCTFARNWTMPDNSNNYYTRTLGTAQGKQARSITAGQYVTVSNAGTPIVYSVSGITSYGTGIKYNNELYAGNGDAVSLTLNHSNITGSTFTGYTVDHGTLSGNDTDGYTLTMPDNDATINAEYCAIPTLLALVDNSITAHGATLNWTGNSDSYSVMVGKADTPTTFQNIDFETGNFSQGDFSFTTDYHFEVYSATSTNKAARSTNYRIDSSTSDMVLQVTIPAAGTLQFRAQVSSQKDYDKAYFSIDGSNKIDGISGSSSQTYSYPLTAGTHTLRWYYTKNNSGYSNKDRFYVDDIIIKVPVPSSWDEYTANATSITLNDLDPSTLYMAKVIGKCGSNGQSEPSNAIYFTTGQETFTKDIVGYENDESGWYLIASPLVGEVSATDVTNLANIDDNDGFDLYRFNQTADLEWENWKSHANNDDHYHFNLESGRGYLYANSEDVTLTFTGTPYSGEGEVTLVKDDDAELSGWNLVGNPFTVNTYIDRPFYIMNEGGSEIIAATQVERNYIEPMEGIFVYTDENGAIMTFSTEEPSKGHSSKPEPEQIVLNLSRNGGSVIDRAIVRLGEGQTLPKFQIRENSTKLYIPQDGKDYAIAVIARRNDEAIQPNEIPVNFRAKENGTYTITVNPENVEMAYLHLIDNKTGADVDLLGDVIADSDPQSPTPSYSFTAKTTDYESRFRLVFVCGDANDDNEAPFAYVNNGEIILMGIVGDAGTASLQVIDMQGRVLVCRDALNASHISTAGMAPGVYVLRLIDGDNIRTQKIVVR